MQKNQALEECCRPFFRGLTDVNACRKELVSSRG